MAASLDNTVQCEMLYAEPVLRKFLGPEWESVNVHNGMKSDGSLSDKYMLVGQTKAGRIVTVELKLPADFPAVISNQNRTAMVDVIRKSLVDALEVMRTTSRPAALFIKA